ncbi:DUF59 domain-containing protein [Babesia caballi]|uniref:DUF59 domain-containing protein n=1 Tax=Babesia caballi TaxID=5871 RepID=A0AAV4LQ77_BABCB|nr:DUF59 domain-containing protein [Babesia caballi]
MPVKPPAALNAVNVDPPKALVNDPGSPSPFAGLAILFERARSAKDTGDFDANKEKGVDPVDIGACTCKPPLKTNCDEVPSSPKEQL